MLLLLGLVFGPQWWATYTFRRYSKPRSDIPGSGAELASLLNLARWLAFFRR